jgi:hypothetical protein
MHLNCEYVLFVKFWGSRWRWNLKWVDLEFNFSIPGYGPGKPTAVNACPKNGVNS